MGSLHRKAPGFRGACVLVVAALLSRLPVFPSVAMTRSFGGGGDTIDWGVHLTSIADHLRYEQGWGSHRPITAFLVDASHPVLLLVAGTLGAHAALWVAGRLPRRARAVGEDVARRATLWAYGVFGVVLALRVLLTLGVVRGPRPLLLGVIGAVLLGILALASYGPRLARGQRILRLIGTLALGAPLIIALLALFAIFDARHAAHVPWAWGVGAAGFVLVMGVRAAVQRRRARFGLR